MQYVRGKPLTPEEKQAIVSVKKYFDHTRQDLGFTEPSVQLTAEALEVGVSTVKRVMADFNRDPDSLNNPPSARGRPHYVIDGNHEEAVRSCIRSANQQGRHLTISDVSGFLEKQGLSKTFHATTLGRTLDRWGFEFGKGKRTQHLKEKDEVIVARQQYLRRMRANR